MQVNSIEATRWTNATLSRIKDGGTWFIPRSGMSVSVVDGAKRIVRVSEGFAPDETVKRSIRNAGWTIKGE